MKFRSFLPLVCLALMSPSVWSCQNNARQAGEADSAAVRIALLPTADCLPYYVADSLGLFDSLGVSVRLVSFNAGMDADTAFCGISADGIVTDIVKAVAWRSRGDSVKAIGYAPAHLRLITARTARLHEAKSLKDKVIGISRNSCSDYWLDRILEDNGLLPKELNRPQINDIALRGRMVDQNQYDGAILPEPYASLSLARGGKLVAESEQTRLLNPAVALLFRESFVHNRQEELVLILQAYNQAAKYINSRRQKHANELLRFLPSAVEVPDSMASVPYFHPLATAMPDSLSDKVRSWCKTRSLLGNDTAQVTCVLHTKSVSHSK